MTASIAVEWLPDPQEWEVVVWQEDVARIGSRRMAAARDDEGEWWPTVDTAEYHHQGEPASSAMSAAEFRSLASLVRSGDADGAAAVAYGRLLFDALLGPELWNALGQPDGPLVVPLRLPDGLLQGLAWELMHDGADYLALRNPGPLILPRLVETGRHAPRTLGRPPRVLFAVGSKLVDEKVQAGAETMAVLRDVGRRGGGIVPVRVLSAATPGRLREYCAAFRPDVVHLVGHGNWAPTTHGRLILRGEGGGEEACGAEELLDALRCPTPEKPTPESPTLVLLSACDGAVSATAASAPLAVELARGGVPIVVAMAGKISDVACRTFARSLVAAVALGVPLFAAVARGRAAARGAAVDSADWALPAVFTGARLDPRLQLTDPARHVGTREAIDRHELESDPLFAGRHEIFAELDALLATDGPASLILTSDYDGQVGGTRALRELAVASIQAGHLPVIMGEFRPGEAPKSLEELATHVLFAMSNVAKREGVDGPAALLELFDMPTLRDLKRRPLPQQDDGDLADALRDDLLDLRDRVHAKRPGVFGADNCPLLLVDDVHHFAGEPVPGRRRPGSVLSALLGLLGPRGLGEGEDKVPVVLFGRTDLTVGHELRAYRDRHGHERGKRFLQLKHIVALPAGHLAFLTWLLNPSDRDGWPQKVGAPRPGGKSADGWVELYKLMMEEDRRSFYDPGAHARYLRTGEKMEVIVTDDDNSYLQAIGMLG